MFRIIKNHLQQFLFQSIRIQLLLFIASLPIVTFWGLPLSALSLLGNIISAPFMIIYFVFSLAWILCYLINLPLFPVTFLLENITQWWFTCLSGASSHALFCLPQPSLIFLALIPLSLLIFLYSSIDKRKGKLAEVGSLFLLAAAWCLILNTSVEQTGPLYLGNTHNKLQVYRTEGKLVVADMQGYLRNNKSCWKEWVRFTLQPFLVTSFGAVSCDILLIQKPTYQRLTIAASIVDTGAAACLAIPSSVTELNWWPVWKKAHPEIQVILTACA